MRDRMVGSELKLLKMITQPSVITKDLMQKVDENNRCFKISSL
jgi:hypothetical protein